MEFHWKLISSHTRPGSNLRVVRWAARIESEGEAARRFIFRECIYEVGTGGLLIDEDEATKRLLQTRYGTTPEACLSDNLHDVFNTPVPC